MYEYLDTLLLVSWLLDCNCRLCFCLTKKKTEGSDQDELMMMIEADPMLAEWEPVALVPWTRTANAAYIRHIPRRCLECREVCEVCSDMILLNYDEDEESLWSNQVQGYCIWCWRNWSCVIRKYRIALPSSKNLKITASRVLPDA